MSRTGTWGKSHFRLSLLASLVQHCSTLLMSRPARAARGGATEGEAAKNSLFGLDDVAAPSSGKETKRPTAQTGVVKPSKVKAGGGKKKVKQAKALRDTAEADSAPAATAPAPAPPPPPAVPQVQVPALQQVDGVRALTFREWHMVTGVRIMNAWADEPDVTTREFRKWDILDTNKKSLFLMKWDNAVQDHTGRDMHWLNKQLLDGNLTFTLQNTVPRGEREYTASFESAQIDELD